MKQLILFSEISMPSQEFPDEHVDRTSVCNELFLPLASSSSCIQMTDMVLLKKIIVNVFFLCKLL